VENSDPLQRQMRRLMPWLSGTLAGLALALIVWSAAERDRLWGLRVAIGLALVVTNTAQAIFWFRQGRRDAGHSQERTDDLG
jgi:hypothetical protein